jgi:hypothetical protein
MRRRHLAKVPISDALMPDEAAPDRIWRIPNPALAKTRRFWALFPGAAR